MKPFSYVRPDTIPQVIALLEEHGPNAKLLAGGTDLIVRMRLRHYTPGVVVDLKRVNGLREDVLDLEHCLRVGARCVMTDLMADHRIRTRFPALVEAASVVGSVQIRNRATLAGNICNASPAADTAPALLVYRAEVNLVGLLGRRKVPIQDFFLGPSRTVLTYGEIVESIDLPLPGEATGASFGRVTRRRGVDLATINLCCAVTASGVTRFAYGAVGPRPFLVEDTGMLASGSRDESQLVAALERLIAYASPRTDVRGGSDYRMAMLHVMSGRCLKTALGRLNEERNGRIGLQ